MPRRRSSSWRNTPHSRATSRAWSSSAGATAAFGAAAPDIRERNIVSGTGRSYERPVFIHTAIGSSRLACSVRDRRRGLTKQDGALLRGANAAMTGIDLLRQLVGPLHRRTRRDSVEPAFEMREVADLLALQLMRHHPR